MEPLDVRILDRDYRLMVSAPNRPRLLEAVRRVDDTMRQIRDGGRVTGNERVAVMAALQLATEFIELRDSDTGMPVSAVQQAEQRIDALSHLIDAELQHLHSGT